MRTTAPEAPGKGKGNVSPIVPSMPQAELTTDVKLGETTAGAEDFAAAGAPGVGAEEEEEEEEGKEEMEEFRIQCLHLTGALFPSAAARDDIAVLATVVAAPGDDFPEAVVSMAAIVEGACSLGRVVLVRSHPEQTHGLEDLTVALLFRAAQQAMPPRHMFVSEDGSSDDDNMDD